jgi:hypothetical protein
VNGAKNYVSLALEEATSGKAVKQRVMRKFAAKIGLDKGYSAHVLA